MKYGEAGTFRVHVRNSSGPVTGDAANLSCQLSKDGGTRVNLTTNTATPIDKSDGVTETGDYTFPVSATEATAHALSFSPVSSTSGVECFGVPGNLIYTSLEEAIKVKTDLILSASAINTAGGPVGVDGQISVPLIIGDDYLAAHGRAFTWTIADPGFTYGTASCKLGFSNPSLGDLEKAGTITDDGSTWTLSFDLLAAETATLTQGPYDWSVHVTDNAYKTTRVRWGKYRAQWVDSQTTV